MTDCAVPRQSLTSLEDCFRAVVGDLLATDPGNDYWERQQAMEALLAWEHPLAASTVGRWLDRAIETQTSDGWLCFGATSNLVYGSFRIMEAASMRNFVRTASCAAYYVAPLASLYERTGDESYRLAAHRQLEAVLSGPRTSEGFLLMNAAAPEVWVDEVYPVCGALARWGMIESRQAWVDEAYEQLRIAFDRLVDAESGLARHVWRERPNSFPESTFWARGNGWLACASAEVLAAAGTHPESTGLKGRLAELLCAMLRVQDRSGMVHDCLDDPSSPLETSGTLMFAHAAGLALRCGLEVDGLATAAVRAIRAVPYVTTSAGSIGQVSLPPGGPGIPLGSMALAQSFFLSAAYHLQTELGLVRPWEATPAPELAVAPGREQES